MDRFDPSKPPSKSKFPDKIFALVKFQIFYYTPDEEQVQNSDNQNAIGDLTPTTKERTTYEEQVQNSDNQNAIGDLTPTTKERTTCIWMAKTLMALSQNELHMQHQLLMAQ
ncbi:unnamed protein product [Pieris brassicae]|uniref:Uncharacterized protein n=1 Tax=Pieris brassicae TaxID=7116 RepID=A0A9P0TWE4_PIEBR|nr:unnamed protein product [Pieris brassicae]